MVHNLAAPVDAPWAAYEWLQAASDASGTLDRRESVSTCRSFAAEVELHPELFPSETADSGLDALFTSFDQRVAEDEEVVADLRWKSHGTRTVAPRREPCARVTFPHTGSPRRSLDWTFGTGRVA
jgi:hypothetical protein